MAEAFEAIDLLQSLRHNYLPVGYMIYARDAPNQYVEVVVVSLCEAALD
ncbi:MAG TPA: hypothetical protein VKB49_26185 [Candidatus Sulfotelmatobacter sp.]|nr:hypothetical protein [Candidatus Sulfotelmatobacter sp.]